MADATSIGSDKEQNKLITRMLNGVKNTKYKEVDYDELRSKAQDMKFKGNKSLIKVKKIEQAAKDTKEKHMRQQHHAIWFKELSRLNSLRRKYSAEVDLHIRHGRESEETSLLFEDIEEYSDHILNEESKFTKTTVDPVWELRDDLKYWVTQFSVQYKQDPSTAGENLGDPNEIMETILSVRQQQNKILERLLNERLSLEQELGTGFLGELSESADKYPKFGIPSEALELESPDESLKISILQEFLLIDQKYTERLQVLDNQYSEILSNDLGGWEKENHLEFQAILDQHPFDLHHRRQIYIDRMKRHWPMKSRYEIVEHEDWVLAMRNYQQNKKSLINDWFRDKKELLTKAAATFYEAKMEQKLNEAKSERVKQQKELCDLLYHRVKTWRQEKMEAMLIKQRILEEQLENSRRQRLEEEEKVSRKRAKEKEKIRERHEKLAHEQRQASEQDRIRLEELQRRHAEQALIDAERVRFREKLELERKMVQQIKKEEEIAKEQEKEERLEALREKVRVVAEADPYRMIKDTENWQNRKKPDPYDSAYINQPLFEINTFNSKQISSDPRIKLENRLREVGLHGTDYARHVLSTVAPAKPPRKDTLHTVKFGD